MQLRTPGPLLAAAVALLAVAPAFGLTPRVKDEAEFFSSTAVKKADEVIGEIKDRYQKDLLIETFKTVPSNRADRVEHADRGERERFFAEWARERARDAGVNGVYVLICKDPGHVQVEVGNHTSKRAFTVEDRDHLRDILVRNFKAKELDKGLLEGVEYVRDTMKDNLAGSGRAEGGAPASPIPGGGEWSPPAPQRPHFTLGPGLIVVLIVGAVGLLLVLGLIRWLSRAAGGYPSGGGYPAPGPGYGGYGGYGGGYGGGGGGFFSSLFGSMFGSAAGNWVYDRFFRGGSPGDGGGWQNTAPQAPPPDASSQPDTDYSGSGGDFDDNAPADTGGGGELGSGDFYAGGGDGGGGDIGGGGGDTGGGGDF